MITEKQIEEAKAETKYQFRAYHRHDDCILAAYEWLDAQIKTQNIVKNSRTLKHMIENWAGQYISQADIEVAALLHPDVIGNYPRLNISARLVLPSDRRLASISTAKTGSYAPEGFEVRYFSKEL